MKRMLAFKSGFALVHDEFYNNFYFGTEKEIKNLSMPCNQYGKLKEIRAELERWKKEVDADNLEMQEIENAFLLALSQF